MADLRLVGYDNHQPRAFSDKAIYATIKYGRFNDNDIYDDQGRRWVKAQAVWISKKRFSNDKSFYDFFEFAKNLPNLKYYTDPEGVIWFYCRPAN